MQFSERFRKEAKKLGMPEQTVLMTLGYTESEAFNIAYSDRDVRSVDSNINFREAILSDQKFKDMLHARIERFKSGVTLPQNAAELDLMTREEAVKEILQSAKNMPLRSKERGEMFIKYNEALTKLQKNDESVDAVNIYLPLKCHKCQLYKDFIERQGEKIEERIMGED